MGSFLAAFPQILGRPGSGFVCIFWAILRGELFANGSQLIEVFQIICLEVFQVGLQMVDPM
jgi:hypothetical protein